MDTRASSSRRQGRPRDGDVSDRILAEAREVYAERGWSGFNFDVVAKRARVSKDALYRRYSSRAELLVAVMASATAIHTREDALEDTATLREYLIAVAHDYFAMYTAANGFDFLRLRIEAPRNNDLLEAFHDGASLPQIRRARGLVRSAISMGVVTDVSAGTSLLDALVGGVMMHVLATPPSLFPRMLATSTAYIAGLVDLLLRGAGYREDESVLLRDYVQHPGTIE